jgi:hypothetical protein
VGPLAVVRATDYPLRINDASGQAGSVATVRTDTGSEAFYALTGKQRIRSPNGR